MVKHTQTIRRQKPMNCLSVFDYFVGLTLKGLKHKKHCYFPLKKTHFVGFHPTQNQQKLYLKFNIVLNIHIMRPCLNTKVRL